MSSTPSLTSDSGRQTVHGAGYSLSWRTGPRGVTTSPYLELSDADGARWMRICALSSAHTLDARDEAMSIFEPEVRTEPDAVVVTIRTESSAWDERLLELRCTTDAVEITLEARGAGELTDVTILGGDGILPTGASGTFRSGLSTRSRSTCRAPPSRSRSSPCGRAASLGVVGDAEPGRLNGVFSPPPLALAFGRDPRLTPSPRARAVARDVAARGRSTSCGFTTMRFDPVDGGGLLRLAHEGHTSVDGVWRSPTVVVRPGRIRPPPRAGAVPRATWSAPTARPRRRRRSSRGGSSRSSAAGAPRSPVPARTAGPPTCAARMAYDELPRHAGARHPSIRARSSSTTGGRRSTAPPSPTPRPGPTCGAGWPTSTPRAGACCCGGRPGIRPGFRPTSA